MTDSSLSKFPIPDEKFFFSINHTFLEDTHVRLATIWSPQNMPCAVVEPSVIGREWIQSADVST